MATKILFNACLSSDSPDELREPALKALGAARIEKLLRIKEDISD